MSELRDKSHALIFPGKKDTPIYKIKKDIMEIRTSIEEIKNDILEIKKILLSQEVIQCVKNFTYDYGNSTLEIKD